MDPSDSSFLSKCSHFPLPCSMFKMERGPTTPPVGKWLKNLKKLSKCFLNHFQLLARFHVLEHLECPEKFLSSCFVEQLDSLQGKMSIHNSCLLIYRRNPPKISLKKNVSLVNDGQSWQILSLSLWSVVVFLRIPPIYKLDGVYGVNDSPMAPPQTHLLLKKNRPAGNTGRCHGGQKEVGHVTGQILFLKWWHTPKKNNLAFKIFLEGTVTQEKTHAPWNEEWWIHELVHPETAQNTSLRHGFNMTVMSMLRKPARPSWFGDLRSW